MTDEILEKYISQHIDASPENLIRFSWHGGEPLLLGLDFFHKVIDVQNKHKPSDKIIRNGIQTNGTLINEEWCKFLSSENFSVGLSLDGPRDIHNRYRVGKNGEPTHKSVMNGYKLLVQHGVYPDILCVVNAHNAQNPLKVYRFFKKIQAQYISFLPMVELIPDSTDINPLSVPPNDWGNFLCIIFNEWRDNDIGRVKIQIIEEATRTAFNQEHSLCIFQSTCGNIPVVEHNGDFYSCDHYVNQNHFIGNITETPLVDLLKSPAQKTFGQSKLTNLPDYCIKCEVRPMCNGECPKNRLLMTPDGKPGLNYLCEGYKMFFKHCQPFVTEVSNLWKRQTRE
jgi:uncharacterized protein